jgi:hypothetical protein
VRILQYRKRQAEGGMRSLCETLSRATQPGKLGIHFYADTKKQEVTLEGAKTEEIRQHIDGRWRRERGARRLEICRYGMRVAFGTEAQLQARKLGDEIPLIRFAPMHACSSNIHSIFTK